MKYNWGLLLLTVWSVPGFSSEAVVRKQVSVLEANGPARAFKLVSVERNKFQTGLEYPTDCDISDWSCKPIVQVKDLVRVTMSYEVKNVGDVDSPGYEDYGTVTQNYDFEPDALNPRLLQALTALPRDQNSRAEFANQWFRGGSERVVRAMKQIDYARSHFCDSSSFHCEDEIVYLPQDSKYTLEFFTVSQIVS